MTWIFHRTRPYRYYLTYLLLDFTVTRYPTFIRLYPTLHAYSPGRLASVGACRIRCMSPVPSVAPAGAFCRAARYARLDPLALSRHPRRDETHC